MEVTTLEKFTYKDSVTELIREVFPNTGYYSNEDESFIYTSHEGEGYNVVFPKDLSYFIKERVQPSYIALCMINQIVKLIIEEKGSE